MALKKASCRFCGRVGWLWKELVLDGKWLHCLFEGTVNSFSSVKKMKSVANWKNVFKNSLLCFMPEVQFSSVSLVHIAS